MKRQQLPVIITTAIPLIAIVIILLIQGVNLTQVYLPCSGWNDEVLYYKIIEGTIKYGHPMGYYGYNESIAQLLTFGSWSPFLIWPQVIWGKIFGWNIISPIVCNMVLLCVSFAIIALIVNIPMRRSRLSGVA